jgi:hypothetical protein
MLFNLPLDLDLVGSWRAWSRMDGGLQALGHEPPSHANDGREPDIQSLDDLLISAAGSARRFVAQEQDPCMDQLSCRGLARGHHPIQCLTLLDGQGHLVLLHRGTPSLGPESSHGLKESRSHLTCQLMLHRLEAGGFASRLKARLLVVSAESVPLPDQISLRGSWLLTTSTLKARGSKADRLFDRSPRRTGSGRLEGEGF